MSPPRKEWAFFLPHEGQDTRGHLCYEGSRGDRYLSHSSRHTQVPLTNKPLTNGNKCRDKEIKMLWGINNYSLIHTLF